MEMCQFRNCPRVGTTTGIVLARNPEGGKDIPTEVVACEKHKETPGFFENEKVKE